MHDIQHPSLFKDAWVGVLDILGFKDLVRKADEEFPRILRTSKLDDPV